MDIWPYRRSIGAVSVALCVSLIFASPGAPQPILDQILLWQHPECGGSAVGDFNNDGWPDVFRLECRGDQIALMHNGGGGTFARADQTARIQDALPGKRLGYGQTFADYDNDGDLDLFVAVGMWDYDERDRNVLLRNDRGVFTDVALEAGLTDVQATDNAVWFDYDRDGHLDLYTGNIADPGARNLLYRNRGDGTFTNTTEEAGLNIALNDPPEPGGSNGGLLAADFNNDGWPDLYMGVLWGRNRLFLNSGEGHFQDATTEEIGDPGQAFDVGVGDINNDGNLDIFQAAGGLIKGDRSLLLMNLGGGQFLDVTESVGLEGIFENTQDVGFGDIDNDGDQDLFISFPSPLVYLNDGNGFFVEAASQIVGEAGRTPVAFGDINLDGSLDGPGYRALFLNKGNDNHSLRVELVGIESNRCGIGARLIATSGELRQTQEILGGRGFNQDEMVAHFGLGQRIAVDRLEIRWPSDQVDILTDVPADQKIRVIEGRGTFHAIEPTRWEEAPDTVVLGSKVDVGLTVRPALFEPDATITEVTADLSPFGGGEKASLEAVGDGSYLLRDTSLSIEGVNGLRTLSVMIDQQTSLGPYWTNLSRAIAVLPDEDHLIFDEGTSGEWQMELGRNVEMAAPTGADMIHTGSGSGVFQVEESFAGWSVGFRAVTPVPPYGYTLRLALSPGEITLPRSLRFSVALSPGKGLSLLEGEWIDLGKKEWQVVEIPVDAFDRQGPVEAVTFSGNYGGTFYLDDIRLVAADPTSASTAVLEGMTPLLPQTFTLDQNYPNPFNSSTAIRYALPTTADVDLAIFNLAGQRVATLAEGMREAGTYTVRWDGRDSNGRALASGVYLYRLRTGDGQQVETRKLVLIR